MVQQSPCYQVHCEMRKGRIWDQSQGEGAAIGQSQTISMTFLQPCVNCWHQQPLCPCQSLEGGDPGSIKDKLLEDVTRGSGQGHLTLTPGMKPLEGASWHVGPCALHSGTPPLLLMPLFKEASLRSYQVWSCIGDRLRSQCIRTRR